MSSTNTRDPRINRSGGIGARNNHLDHGRNDFSLRRGEVIDWRRGKIGRRCQIDLLLLVQTKALAGPRCCLRPG